MTTTSSAIDGLLYVRNGYSTMRWNFPDAVGTPVNNPGGIGNAVELSYSFLSASPSYFTAPSFMAFNTTQQLATREVLAAIGEISDISFTEVAGVGQLTFGQSSQSIGQAGYASLVSYGYSYSGSPSTIVSVTESDVGGDVWINRNASWVSDDWLPGGGGYATLMHEIGHALGMKHPFELTTLIASLDNEAHTVMSYNQAPNSLLLSVSGDQWSYSWTTYSLRPSTLMPLDIQALQYLYGANTTTRTGNDTYHWSTNSELLETIWDAAGTDTIDCSNQTLTCIIDLRGGAYSSIALRQTSAEIRQGLDIPDWFSGALPSGIYNGSNNLAIAYGVVIERAVGGSGNDQLIGSDVANSLIGGAGRDSLSGGNGNDSLDGGSGIDTMLGGAGNDSYALRNSGDVITETAGAGTDIVLSYLASHVLGPNMENGRIMLAGAASLTGNSLNNLLYAGAGSNVIDAGAGIDTVSYLYGVTASGGVKVSLATTVAQSTGASGSDTLLNIENLIGSAGNDMLTGNSLVNTLEGGLGDDVLDGAGGTDSLSYRSASAAVKVNLALAGKQATGGAGGDTLSNFENLIGSAYADTLAGNASANLLRGASGQDTLTGGAGRDIFDYDASADSTGAGDLIKDFVSMLDRIDVSNIDASTITASSVANEAFVFIGAAAFSATNATAQLRYAYDSVSHVGTLYGSTDTDNAAEFAIRLTGVTALNAATDLIL